MKKLYILLFLFSAFYASAQDPFIFTWQATTPGVYFSGVVLNDPANNYTINFGDGTVLTNQTTASGSHNYTTAGIYTITISGNYKRVDFGGLESQTAHSVKTLEQWGDAQWKSMSFAGCTNMLVNATDIPDLSQVTSTQWMFAGCSQFNAPINNWNVSNVTDMKYMFYQTPFNQPLNNWNVSNVTDMSGMFNSSGFNQPIENWNVSNVSNMSNMFKQAGEFNQPLNSWDVSNVTNMENMFYYAYIFNQPLNSWDTSAVINMTGMFNYANAFNGSINDWDVSHVINGDNMFGYANSFNQSLNDWDVSAMTSMNAMFVYANAFNQPLNNWDISNVTNITSMFMGASSFNQSLNDWDVSNVINMVALFSMASSFNQPLNNWDIINVTDINRVFEGASSFNYPLDNWDVSNVTNMRQTFSNAMSFNQSLENWDVSAVTNMEKMFNSATVFNQPLNSWDVSNVTNMKDMFNFASAFNQPLSNWDVSHVTVMTMMFYKAISFNSALNGWSVSGNIANMFNQASAFNQDISSWNFNSNVFMNALLSNSGMDTDNYDALLLRFAQLGLVNKQFNALGMHYCDSGVRQYLDIDKGWTFAGDSLGTECVGNTISGNVRFDENANGCDTNDVGVGAFLISADNNANAFSYSASASTVGAYIMKVPTGAYSLGLLNLPEYYTLSPVTSQVVFNGVGSTQSLNFCVTSNETVNDLSVVLLPLEEARPGFETDYQLVVQNMGTQSVANATVTLTFDSTLQTFLIANPVPAAATANQLTFAIANLQPFQTSKINLTMQLFAPPVIIGNEVSNFTATITPDANDFTPNDNTFELAQTIVNSFDPNDKRVLQGEEILLSETDEYLDYIIRFQNTGTASAVKVRVKDVLAENLDWSTFQMVSASHNYKVQIKDGNRVEFIFDNINLPHEAGNEPASHGFIAYKIKPVASVQVGDIILSNTASIYFDYNLPIITNDATTTIIQDIEPMEISVVATNVSCNGANDGTATVTATGGSGTYTYSWSPAGGSQATATGLAAGVYTVALTDGFGTINTLTMIITQPGAMSITTQPQDVSLIAETNTSFSVNASNVDHYQWQVSENGTNWDAVSNGGTAPSYSGATTATMNIEGMPLAYDGYKYRVLLTNGEDCTTYSDEATAEVNTITGLNNFDDLGITVYPNPSQAEVFINIPDISGNANLKIRVLDINGRTLLEEPISDNLKKINISDFASGIYIFSITSDKGSFSKHIIRQ